ncbi:DUF871 domain-containing protein [Priestia megaterium]|nr:DUF871 domain-containing protein [Priestia megaterium]
MIGISFYLTDEFAEQRIIEASKKGVKRAFTSLHIPEEKGDLANRAKQLLKTAKENGIQVYADVSMNTPKHLGIESLEELISLGVAGIRLDDAFDGDTILHLAAHFQIAINASTVLERELQALVEAGLDCEKIIAWHNFYPRSETGLAEEFFLKQGKLFKRCNIPVCAYVPGRGEKRGPLFEGLPTLEKHRHIDPFLAAVELDRYGINDVYIGDPDPGEMLLEQLVKFDQDRILPIRIQSAVLQAGNYRIRPDLARDVIRLQDTRCAEPVPPFNTINRSKGSVTMDNDLYGRYRGELQIALCDLPADKRVNVVGEVIPQDIPLLSMVQPGQTIEIKTVD